MLDAVHKRYYDKYREQGIPPLLKGKFPFKLVDSKLAEKVRSGVYFKDEKLNAILWGKMDDCFVDKKGRLVVIDNKTSTSSEPNAEYEEGYKFQLDTYAFLLIKNGFKVHPDAFLIYYFPEKEGDFNKGVKFTAHPKKIKLDPDRIQGFFEKAVKVARRSKAPARHEECDMCIWLEGMTKN